MHNGIDVSGFQGFPDFRKVADAGKRFVYIKATEGTDFIDGGFEHRQHDARTAGLHTGFYHFLRPRADRNGRAEAEHFYRTVQGISKGRGNAARLLRLALDVEVSTLPEDKTREYARDCLTRLKELCQHEPILYTFPGFLTLWGTELSAYSLWLAHFTDAPHPTLPHGFTHWTMWQHTSTGRCPGVNGNVDLNRCPKLAPILLDRAAY